MEYIKRILSKNFPDFSIITAESNDRLYNIPRESSYAGKEIFRIMKDLNEVGMRSEIGNPNLVAGGSLREILILACHKVAEIFKMHGHHCIYYVELGVDSVKTKLCNDALEESGLKIVEYIGIDMNHAACNEMRQWLSSTIPNLPSRIVSQDWYLLNFSNLGLLDEIPSLVMNLGFQETMIDPHTCFPMLQGMLRSNADILLSEFQVFLNEIDSIVSIENFNKSTEMQEFSKVVFNELYPDAAISIEETETRTFMVPDENNQDLMFVVGVEIHQAKKMLYVMWSNYKYTISEWNRIKSKYLNIIDTISTEDQVNIVQISSI